MKESPIETEEVGEDVEVVRTFSLVNERIEEDPLQKILRKIIFFVYKRFMFQIEFNETDPLSCPC